MKLSQFILTAAVNIIMHEQWLKMHNQHIVIWFTLNLFTLETKDLGNELETVNDSIKIETFSNLLRETKIDLITELNLFTPRTHKGQYNGKKHTAHFVHTSCPVKCVHYVIRDCISGWRS